MFSQYVWVQMALTQYVSRIFNASFRQKGCEGPGLVVEDKRDEPGVNIA